MTTVKVQKDIRGNWRAEDTFDLPDNRTLVIYTSKTFSGHTVTSAVVNSVEGSLMSHVMYQDFRKLLVTTKPARCTSKYVADQHGTTIETMLESVKHQIAVYYSSK